MLFFITVNMSKVLFALARSLDLAKSTSKSPHTPTQLGGADLRDDIIRSSHLMGVRLMSTLLSAAAVEASSGFWQVTDGYPRRPHG